MQTKIDKTLSVKDRIDFLRQCAKLYETGNSLVTDADYDAEYYELQRLAPNDPFWDEVGGMEDHIYGTSVPHKIKMGSLSKSLSPEEFFDWLKSAYSQSDNPSFVLQHKVDGLSLALTYKDGKLAQALTRGDGTNGIDVTANAVYVRGVQTTISCKDEVEIRGECNKDRFDFYKNWQKEGYKNPRNFAAGSLNQKDAKVTGERGLDFIAYEVVRKEFVTEVDKDDFLIKNGFKTLRASSKLTKAGNTLEQIYKAVKAYMDSIDRANLPYSIDGVVVKLNDCRKARAMGTTDGGKKPKAHRAVKFPPSEAETILLGVEDNVGRIGTVAPVALLKPVDLDGAMIGRASLHNYGMIRDSKDLRIGSIVVIAKKGDIIPQIIRVKKAGDKPLPIPTVCPCCKEKLEWDANKVNLVCNNDLCVSQLNARIEHWFSKLGTKGIGPGIISRFTDKNVLSWEGEPIITTVSEMYYKLDNDRQTEHPFRKYNYLKEQLGEKMYENILNSIKSVKEVTLAQFIEALGIGKVGRMAKDITDIAPAIDDIDKLTVDDITKIPGFGEIKARNFVDGWKALRPEITKLLKYVSIKQQSFVSQKLAGKKFCFTGSFSRSREEMQQIVVDNGGKASSSVGKDVILVWDGEEQGNKLSKAQSGGNQIVSESDFLKLIEG